MHSTAKQWFAHFNVMHKKTDSSQSEIICIFLNCFGLIKFISRKFSEQNKTKQSRKMNDLTKHNRGDFRIVWWSLIDDELS